jgi:hypothetical protein
MPLTSAQRAYAAAYQTALVEDEDEPNPTSFGITEGHAEMLQIRVEKGTVDFSDVPEILQPPELDTE